MTEQLLRDIYGHLAGILLVQKFVVQVMIVQGLLDRRALIDVLDTALEQMSEEDKRESFGRPIVSLHNMLTGHRVQKSYELEGSFPDWMGLIQDLPPLGTDTSEG